MYDLSNIFRIGLVMELEMLLKHGLLVGSVVKPWSNHNVNKTLKDKYILLKIK